MLKREDKDTRMSKSGQRGTTLLGKARPQSVATMEVTITLLTLGPSMANKGYMPA
jgi:hypothetical protein